MRLSCRLRGTFGACSALPAAGGVATLGHQIQTLVQKSCRRVAMTGSCVLVTGAFGLVGTAVVAELAGQGHRVVATDLDVPANRKRADAVTARPGVEVRWADLTSTTDVDALLAAVTPTAIIHLAAIIPPFCYARPGLAQAVN